MSKLLRCAVYTRKSTEEGLDQDFNSLDAQREACEAFVLSQAGEGWKLLSNRYDDGGISGGTMERPGLQKMLEDIRNNRIDVVVVYKIDRLTRSLMDFAKMVDIFDGNDVSFVSVTQAFNTTNSMGRLTLNVLLSFAQFEREVTAERIRDKIAASKKKGMWMGGTVPLGYEARDRKLVIREEEAKTVRFLFDRYLELGSVRQLSEEAQQANLIIRRSRRKDGTPYMTRPFGRGQLYHLLANPIYAGKIRHGEKVYDGEHEAIISEEQFREIQEQLARKAPKRSHPINNPDTHLLTGILFDETGDRLSPTHANKKGVRYRYYISQRLIQKRRNRGTKADVLDRPDGSRSVATGGDISVSTQTGSGWRVPARELEDIIDKQVIQLLRNKGQLTDWTQQISNTSHLQPLLERAESRLEEWRTSDPTKRRAIVQMLFQRITLKPNWLCLELERKRLLDWIGEGLDCKRSNGIAPRSGDRGADTGSIQMIELPITLKRRGVEAKLVLSNAENNIDPCPDPALIDLLVRANRYLGSLTDGSGKSLNEIGQQHQIDPSEVSRLLPFAFLSPKIVETILTGTQPPELIAKHMARISDLPTDWSEQEQLLGF